MENELPQNCVNLMKCSLHLACQKTQWAPILLQSSKAFTEPPRAPQRQKQNSPSDGRGGPVAGGGPVRCDGELGPYNHG
jgi:hypothetical protein